jgi:transposase
MDQLEYRSLIKFLTLEGETPKNIDERMTRVYGDMCPSYTTVKNWARDVRCGREQVEDEPRSGRPSTVVTDENIQAVEDIFMEDRRITLDEITDILRISHERIHHIIHQ